MENVIYPGTFTQEDIIGSATVSLVPGVYTKIGEYVVKADELVGLGRGGYAAQNEAIGRLYASFKDGSGTPVQISNGKFRVMVESSQDMPIGAKPVAIDVDLAALLTGANNPAERYALPFDGTMLSKDKKFVFLIKNNTASSITLTKANCSVLMDTTRQLV